MYVIREMTRRNIYIIILFHIFQSIDIRNTNNFHKIDSSSHFPSQFSRETLGLHIDKTKPMAMNSLSAICHRLFEPRFNVADHGCDRAQQ